MSIKDNVKRVYENIYETALKTGRNPESITLVAVTKKRTIGEIQEAVDAGVTNFGENRVLEASEKIPFVKGGLTWHLIGHLQSNKIKEAVKSFGWIESLDSFKLADLLSERAEAENKKVNVLIQVKISDEDSKSGISADEAKNLILYSSAKKMLIVRGLMAIGTFGVSADYTRKEFAFINGIFMRLKNDPETSPFTEVLSMGMSGDYRTAVEEGSTMVRIGTAIFEKNY